MPLLETSKRSPFFIVSDALSHLGCETLIESLDPSPILLHPVTKLPVKTNLHGRYLEPMVDDTVASIRAEFENHYNITIADVKNVTVEWYAEGAATTAASIHTHTLRNQQWTKASQTDFIGLIFCSEYNARPPFDSDYEVYGGQIDFPTFRVQFKPVMGTMVIFPAAANFIWGVTQPAVGDLFLVKFDIVCTQSYQYDRQRHFSTDYRTWGR